MIIDWFTVIAQICNFLVLIWLLKRFLYKPILNAIDAREERIAAAQKEAENIQAEALLEKEDFILKNKEFNQQRAALFQEERDKAEAEGHEMMKRVRLETDEYRLKRQEAIRREQQSLNEEISQKVRGEVFAISRKVLADLADSSLEEQMSEVFMRRLQELDDVQKENLSNGLKSPSSSLHVCSACELTGIQQKKILQTLHKIVSPEAKVRFETDTTLISGIELTANGQKIAWSIKDYLESLEKKISELMKEPEKILTSQEKSGTDTLLRDNSKTSPALVKEVE